MKYNLKIKTLAFATTLTSFVCAENVEDKKPNIVYIFPDQLRLHALGIWSDPEYKNILSTVGDPVHTPNLDKLAKQGVLFTQATSTHPVSSPHRAMLFSGAYPAENGVADINCKFGREQELKHELVCLTDVLAKGGYETAYVGKAHWHKTEALFDEKGTFVNTTDAPGGKLIGEYDTYVPPGPSRHNNKFWFQQLNDNHFDAIVYSNCPELIGGKKDGEQFRPKRFTTEVEADAIIKYLENKNNERIEDKPFSIIWSINPPHPPYSKIENCDKEVYDKYYRDMPKEKLLARENTRVEATVKGDKIVTDKKLDITARVYFSLITSVDYEIGRVLDKLEELGEADNTIVVFTADHGEMLGSQRILGKNQIYDESFLVPMMIRYPGVIEHRTDDLLLGTIDIMPTLLSMVGLKDETPSTAIGYDYSQGILTGKYKELAKPKSALYIRQDLRGVKSDRYTYEVSQKGEYRLFDNLKDPYQINNIRLEDIPASDAKMLKKELGFWLAKEGTPRWFENKLPSELVIYP